MDQKETLEEKFRKSTLTSFSSFFSFTNVTCGTFLIPLLYWGKIKNVFYSTDAWCFVPESTVISCKSKASQLLFSQRRPPRFITASKYQLWLWKPWVYRWLWGISQREGERREVKHKQPPSFHLLRKHSHSSLTKVFVREQQGELYPGQD